VAKKASIPMVHGPLLHSSGEIVYVDLENSINGIKGVVGGYAERVVLRDGADLFFNDDRRLGLPPNLVGRAFANLYSERPFNRDIVGSVLILGRGTVDGDSADAPEWIESVALSNDGKAAVREQINRIRDDRSGHGTTSNI